MSLICVLRFLFCRLPLVSEVLCNYRETILRKSNTNYNFFYDFSKKQRLTNAG